MDQFEAVFTARFKARIVGGAQWVPEGSEIQKLGENDFIVTLIYLVGSNTATGPVTIDQVPVDEWGVAAGSQVPHSIPVTPFTVMCS
jgi:hypothetical protein